jgi:hypothetical protein
VVRPERFELPTLWFEAARATPSKRFLFNHLIDKSKLTFVAHMCVGVPKCSGLHVGSLQKSLQSAAVII